MMQVNDLSYLVNTHENKLILGGASAVIEANASAKGNNSLTITETDLELKTKKNGTSNLKGTGIALAIGEDPTADVYYELEGFDKVKVKTISRNRKNYDLEIAKIRAIDRPNR